MSRMCLLAPPVSDWAWSVACSVASWHSLCRSEAYSVADGEAVGPVWACHALLRGSLAGARVTWLWKSTLFGASFSHACRCPCTCSTRSTPSCRPRSCTYRARDAPDWPPSRRQQPTANSRAGRASRRRAAWRAGRSGCGARRARRWPRGQRCTWRRSRRRSRERSCSRGDCADDWMGFLQASVGIMHQQSACPPRGSSRLMQPRCADGAREREPRLTQQLASACFADDRTGPSKGALLLSAPECPSWMRQVGRAVRPGVPRGAGEAGAGGAVGRAEARPWQLSDGIAEAARLRQLEQLGIWSA